MEIKTNTTKFRYRIEPKTGGGFIARAEKGPAETLEGVTREELQQKIDDKLTALVGDMLHNDKLAGMVGEVLQKRGIGGLNVKVNVTTNSSKSLAARAATSPGGNPSLAQSSEPLFEGSNKAWIVIALLVAIGALFLYFLKR